MGGKVPEVLYRDLNGHAGAAILDDGKAATRLSGDGVIQTFPNDVGFVHVYLVGK